ncbi:hypothetical protein [Streptomyces sp. BE303]|uniref:hypothetical protein n=1 Tax=Streptomyces sp. BE303 TaxID=3002528 RepID=UPI002E78C6C7|nr:hypothetical protein [Streptomyces sp. BE303]MED7955117.1 hypothetical protein [Streptomyces sp. BE303]
MSAKGTPARQRRICLVVDIEAYSGRLYPVQGDIQDRLHRALDHAFVRARVERGRCEAQDRGDGQLLLLPPGTNEAVALPGLVLGLRDAVHTLNRSPGTTGRLRIRVALAQGGVQRAALGFTARSVETACRLLDCAQARAALKDTPEADLVLVVTDDLYTDVFEAGVGGLAAGEFTRTTVRIKDKRFEAHAWLATPRRGELVALPPPRTPGTRRRAATSAVLQGALDLLAGAGLGVTPSVHHGGDGGPGHGHGGGQEAGGNASPSAHHDGDDPWEAPGHHGDTGGHGAGHDGGHGGHGHGGAHPNGDGHGPHGPVDNAVHHDDPWHPNGTGATCGGSDPHDPWEASHPRHQDSHESGAYGGEGRHPYHGDAVDPSRTGDPHDPYDGRAPHDPFDPHDVHDPFDVHEGHGVHDTTHGHDVPEPHHEHGGYDAYDGYEGHDPPDVHFGQDAHGDGWHGPHR